VPHDSWKVRNIYIDLGTFGITDHSPSLDLVIGWSDFFLVDPRPACSATGSWPALRHVEAFILDVKCLELTNPV
jgi:hypothetical protein